MAAELFDIPDIKPQVGWRMNEQDMKNMRLLMADRREKSVSAVLRALVQQEAALTRGRWLKSARRIAELEERVNG